MYVSIFNLFSVSILLLPLAVQATQGLTLQQAETIAIQRDVVSKSYDQKAMAFNEQSKASNTWSDPRIKFGAQAVPVDSFDLEQEPMTQIVLGYQQMLLALSGSAQSNAKAINIVNSSGSAVANGVNISRTNAGDLSVQGGNIITLTQNNVISHSR